MGWVSVLEDIDKKNEFDEGSFHPGKKRLGRHREFLSYRKQPLPLPNCGKLAGYSSFKRPVCSVAFYRDKYLLVVEDLGMFLRGICENSKIIKVPKNKCQSVKWSSIKGILESFFLDLKKQLSVGLLRIDGDKIVLYRKNTLPGVVQPRVKSKGLKRNPKKRQGYEKDARKQAKKIRFERFTLVDGKNLRSIS